MNINRRSAIILAAAGMLPTKLRAAVPIHVVEGTGCECCGAWSDHLRANGFAVTREELYGMQLIKYKMELGIPAAVFSCHVGVAEGYAFEGHVPAEDVRRFLQERPDAIGLAVPGMPYGSPGMGPEDEREAYDVLLIKRDGSTEIYSSYAAAED